MIALLTRLIGRLPVGWLQLTHSKGRLFAALAGVAFADVLVLVQLGILGALNSTIIQGYEMFEADIMISANDANTMTEGSNVPRQYLFEALADPDVVDGTTLFIGFRDWLHNNNDRSLQVFGVDTEKSGFLRPDLAAQIAPLRLADYAILDRMTRGFTAEEAAAVRPQTPMIFELEGRTVTVVDTFEGGVGFAADGYMFASDQTFLRLFPNRSTGAPNHVLLRTARGADAEAVAARLQERIGDQMRVRTFDAAAQEDLSYQTTERPTGIIFGFGVVIGIMVGIVIVYQVLATDVADHLKEYATFKAMGYSQGFFLGIVLEEALVLAVLGFIPGVVIALLLYAGMEAMTALPMSLTITTAVAVLIGTIVACALSGAVATRRLASADPADLF
ncbi:ABC transporter permease DevC [Pontivivens ytuae]|uniref:FtsX-like permease family protein n=1 Tax=Pontivivens ytuae TaxID=2789856 RepID=A0A7S9QBF6_9RHOB|nr:ABC transporter permease DevC [Pontivivens ytuae]QPH52655.1 FtsX-like permease family protein [Pontivivens ytuae]